MWAYVVPDSGNLGTAREDMPDDGGTLRSCRNSALCSLAGSFYSSSVPLVEYVDPYAANA